MEGHFTNVDSFLIHLSLEGQYYFSFISTICSIRFHKNSSSYKKSWKGLYIHIKRYNNITNILHFCPKKYKVLLKFSLRVRLIG